MWSIHGSNIILRKGSGRERSERLKSGHLGGFIRSSSEELSHCGENMCWCRDKFAFIAMYQSALEIMNFEKNATSALCRLGNDDIHDSLSELDPQAYTARLEQQREDPTSCIGWKWTSGGSLGNDISRNEKLVRKITTAWMRFVDSHSEASVVVVNTSFGPSEPRCNNETRYGNYLRVNFVKDDILIMYAKSKR